MKNWKRVLCVVAAIGALSLSGTGMADEYEEAITEDEVVLLDEEIYYDQVGDVALSEVVIEEELELSDAADSFIEDDLFESNEETLTVYAEDVVASGKCGSNISWELSEVGTLIISGSGSMTDYNEDNYTRAPWYEYKSMIVNVIIAEGVTTIGREAFKNCGSLLEITIPNTVGRIGEKAFYKCTSLKSITIPNNVISMGSHVFDRCLEIEEIVIPSKMKEIPIAAFSGCSKLKKVQILGGVQTIRMSAFENCISLEHIDFPSSLKGIDSGAFYKCSNLVNVILPEGLMSLGDAAFAYCDSLVEISIPKGVESLDKTFGYCSKLERVTLSEGLVTIGYRSFSNCHNLKEVIIPDGVETIGSYSFYGCTRLKEISIPSSVKLVGSYAFEMSGLEKVVYGGSNKEWAKITIADAYGHGENDRLINAKKQFTYVFVTGILLEHNTVDLNIGETVQIIAIIRPEDANNKNIIWSSNNENLATVSSEGMVTAISSGEAIISVITEDGDYSAECVVSIHNPEIIPKVEATCTESGLTEGSKCSVCGKILMAQETIPALGHEYGEWQVTSAATCEAGGVETRYCKNNETHVETRTIEALGHDWTDWMVVRAASYDAEGEEQRSCKRDPSHTETRKIAKLVRPVENQPAQQVSPQISASTTAVGVKHPTVVEQPTTLKVTAKGLKKNKVTLKRGKTLKLKAVSNKPVTFKTNKKKVVSVTKKGKLKALKKGKATITITAGDKTIKIKVTVK